MRHKIVNTNNNPNNTNKLSEALDSYIRGCIKTELDCEKYEILFREYLYEYQRKEYRK